MSIITELWRYEWQEEGDLETTIGYLDFKLDGIQGVFRITDSLGVNSGKAVKRILENKEFFQHVETGKVFKVFEEAKSRWNSGNNWEWKEITHPTLKKDYRIDFIVAWHTCPFSGRDPLVKDMNALHSIAHEGVKLLYSWNRNRPPVAVCYFFPLKSGSHE